MYIKRVDITNIRSIPSLTMEFPDNAAGWHVILGDNGSGKSTLLQSIALVLIGADSAVALRTSWETWIRQGQGISKGKIDLALLYKPSLDEDLGNSQPQLTVGVEVHSGTVVGAPLPYSATVRINNGSDPNVFGWFSASYGPYRRFHGGETRFEKVFDVFPRLAAHLSVFGENIALTESLTWLKDLRFKQALGKVGGELLDTVKAFINQEGFLPHEAKLDEVNDEDVIFVDANGNHVPIEDFSDGYRSILSLTFDLIRQMYRAYGSDMTKLFAPNDFTKIIAPGVVTIDEVDAHLHPSWQRKIGFWFREHFPNIQFIVTTHSPLICQAAIDGTIWRLPRPGTDDQLIKAEGEELNRLLYGNVLDAYGTEFFGRDIGRSEVGKEKLQQLADLNIKELEHGLTANEKHEQNELRNMMPTDAAITPNK